MVRVEVDDADVLLAGSRHGPLTRRKAVPSPLAPFSPATPHRPATRIHAVEDEVEIRYWRVETRQGPRSFQTRRDDWPRRLSDSSFLIRDVSGDLHHVRDTRALDRESREWLWAYVE